MGVARVMTLTSAFRDLSLKCLIPSPDGTNSVSWHPSFKQYVHSETCEYSVHFLLLPTNVTTRSSSDHDLSFFPFEDIICMIAAIVRTNMGIETPSVAL